MAGSLESFAGPNYISSRSADVILSDVRPIKLKLEALRSINVLIDEFLYNILKAAGSVSTDKLKTSLIKILSTSLGKEAVLEAELELKAYWERTTPPIPTFANDSIQDFDLQWSFELLRLKCEAYSTMNDTDEDMEMEKQLSERMVAAGGSSPPSATLLAPAALYLTAILEYICEHILSNVSRVAARDSSRTVATVQDLFVALCEDDSTYGMFKSMKVYEQIESLSKTQKPRRSKSFSRNGDRASPAPPTSSPPAESSLRDTSSRLRMSLDSVTSSATAHAPSSSIARTSMDKARAVKMFSRSSSDNSERAELELARVQSEGSQNGNSADFLDDPSLLEEFDELMRSGATMKVSLTPDRLRTMEVYKQERRRSAVQNGALSPSLPEPKRGHLARRPSQRNVDAIVEDEEDQALTHQPPSSYHQRIITPRPRQGSLSQAHSSVSAATASNTRARSISVSAVPQSDPRKKTEMPLPPLPLTVSSPKMQKSSSAPHPKMTGGLPVRTRKVARRQESLDLDDVMGGSEDEENDAPHPNPQPATAKHAVAGGKPYISKAAKELIDFLDEGPPEEPKLSPASASMVSFESSKSKSSGRFQRIMSRLTIGGSRENLNGRGSTWDTVPKTPKFGNRYASSNTSSPPPSYIQSSLNSKRSMPNVIIATPPRPPQPPPLPAPQPISPPSSSHASAEDVSSPTSPSRRLSVARKAVPVFDEKAYAPPVPPVPTEEVEIISPPRDSSQTVLRPVNGNVHAKTALARENSDLRVRKESLHKSNSPTGSVVSDRSGKSEKGPSSSPSTLANGLTNGTSKKSAYKPSTAEKEVSAVPGPEESSEKGLHLAAEDVATIRRLLSAATTADECRLLVDLFLAKSGWAANTTPPSQSPPPPSSTSPTLDPAPETAFAELIALNNTLEISLVSLLLGDSEDDMQEPAIHIQDIPDTPSPTSVDTPIPPQVQAAA